MTRVTRSIAALLAVGLAACAGPAATPSAAPATQVVPSTPAPSTQPAVTPAPATVQPPTTAPSTQASGDVVLLTHDAFAMSDDVIAAFQQQTGYTLKILRAGDAGAMVNQAILSKSHPLGDLLFGVDNTFLSRALNAGIFEPYEAAGLAGVPVEFQLDAAQHRVTPIDYGDVCLNLDKSAFAAGGVPAPATLADLTKPIYKGQLVVENPATSSPGLAFMLASVARFGETGNPGWLDWWSQLRANDVLVSPSWTDAYETQFSAGAGKGPRPIVVSYASSPPAEVVYADPKISAPPTSVMLDGCFRQVEFAGVLAGANNPAGAQALLDFLIGPLAQADVPLQMFVFPAVSGVPLPDVFKQWAQVPTDPLTVDPLAIERNRDRWIDEWTKTVLR